MNSNQKTDYDVLIIGAGLSGIGAAWHIQNDCPTKSFAVLESRSNMGGTWDLFRYPGIRSDSDMYTLGFPFNPWENPKAIADGPSILQYIKDTAKKFGIDKKIKFNHKAIKADWSDSLCCWTVIVESHDTVKTEKITCRYLMACTGYYNYENGYQPLFEGQESFKGSILHPQKWDENISYTNKNVIVIGSGATAVTLVPEIAKKAKKVYMVQRSPTYIMTLPSVDKVAEFLKKILPLKWAYALSRWKNILLSIFFYTLSRKWPEQIKKFILKGIRNQLGQNYDLKHFSPNYKPWDQRLCLVPDSDLFNAISSGRAEMVTDVIRRFTEKGLLTKNGLEIEADLIVTATGLELKLLGGMDITVNGERKATSELHCYRGVMIEEAPNFAFTVGYTNASWTLKCDLSCSFFTKVINFMDKKGYKVVVPMFDPSEFRTEPLLDFDAGYVKRAADILPKQGSKAPWKVHQNYIKDLVSLKWNSVDDKYLSFK